MLVVEGLEIQRGAFRLAASFAAPLTGITALFGPSGAGKSLLLGALAGLLRPGSGTISLGGERVLDCGRKICAPPHRREIGLLFQDARLFPHLSVMGNLSYASSRSPAGGREQRMEAAIRDLELGPLLHRSVRTLSGGERSRVALGRALVSAPRMLLLDEPFAALDGRRRRSYLALLRRIADERALPMLVVTHQVEDAAELSDHLLAIRAGEIIAQGASSETMNTPEFRALLDPRDQGARIAAAAMAGREPGVRGRWVRADVVMLAVQRPEGVSARNVWRGRIVEMMPEANDDVLVSLDTEAGPVLARITQAAANELGFRTGGAAFVLVKSHAA